jgi:hypothetical protein
MRFFRVDLTVSIWVLASEAVRFLYVLVSRCSDITCWM